MKFLTLIEINASLVMDNNATSSRSSPENTVTVITTYFIFEVVIAFFAVVGNSSIIIAFFSYRKLRTTQNYYIVSLATIDFSMGFIAIPFVLITLDGTPRDNKGLCFFLLTCIVLMDLCSIFSVMALTVDRYMAICKPFSYHAIMTPRRTLVHISIAWVVPIAISLLVPLGWNIADESTSACFFAEIVSMKYYTFLYLACFLPLFFIMCGMYRKIFIVIQSQLESLARIQTIGDRLNQPTIVLKTDTDEKMDTGEEDGIEQVRSNDKSHLPDKSIRRKSKRGNERRQWDVTDEILFLKNMEGKDKGEYKPVNDSSDIPAPLEKEDGTPKKDDPVNGDTTVSHLEDANTMSKVEAETNGETGKESQQIPSSSEYNDGKPFIRFHRIRQERKTAILFVFIMMVLFVFWSPIYVIDIFLAFEVNVDQNLINFAVLLSHFNSAFNPILYAYKSEFRRVFKRWALSLCCRCCRICFKDRFSAVHPHTVMDYSQNISLNT